MCIRDRDITLLEDMNGGTVTTGVFYISAITLNKLRIRDEGGFIQTRGNLRISNYRVLMEDTAKLTAEINSTYYPQRVYEWNSLISGGLEGITDDHLVDNEQWFHVPCKVPSTQHSLTLFAFAQTPATITQIEWMGNYTKRGRRF